MSLKHLNPLIDGDIVKYRCAWACEKNQEPLEFVLSTVKHNVEHTLETFPDRNYYKIYLTGPGNYRYRYASPERPYKYKRKDKPQPRFLKEINEYLCDVWGAEVINGREADDAMGCLQWANPDKSTIICSTDKDLDTIPGYHYNWVNQELYYVTINEANRKFYTQLLTGDSVDDVPGVPSIGPKTAEKILAGLEHPAELREAVEREYRKAFGDYWEVRLRESAALLWIQREEDILWTGEKVNKDESTETSSSKNDLIDVPS